MKQPTFVYGTAWKEERTADCVRQALAAGFRAIDTANQRRHYDEAAVGQALAHSELPRESLWLQTKFTYRQGQDHRLPYDAEASLGQQVAQSCRSSLAHLGVEVIDSYLLHGPMGRVRWSDADREVWAAMEREQQEGRVRTLGVSNVSFGQLRSCFAEATLKPAWVQNRCFARTGWDAQVRAFCAEEGIVYQGFSLLTANVRELNHPEIHALARHHQATLPQVVFAFARQVGMLPLTGTTDPEHMAEDLAAAKLELSEAALRAVEQIGV